MRSSRSANGQYGPEDVYEEPADRRARLDPLDPSTFRHAGQCEHRDTTDPAILRAVLKVRDGAGGDYWWVECGTCRYGWQVPHYAAAKNVGDDEPASRRVRSGGSSRPSLLGEAPMAPPSDRGCLLP